MKYKLGNGKTVTGFEALKAWSVVILLFIFVIAVIVGVFFLRSYRWGDCS